MSPETAAKWTVRIGITALCILVFLAVAHVVALLFGVDLSLMDKLITAAVCGGIIAYEWIKGVEN